MIKNKLLVVSDNRKTPFSIGAQHKKWFYRELIIKKDFSEQLDGITKLSDVLTKLPSGIVYKDETGMGATTLELISKRNSIIVEPIRITASSKASKSNKYLYVGSPTEIYHPNKIRDVQIEAYLLNPKIKPKKIIVVADSLWRVMEAITKVELKTQSNLSIHNKRVKSFKINDKKNDSITSKPTYVPGLKDFFLLIDEIDSFQLDSSFRRSMEACLDYYKLFKKEKRCMLSATDILFSDPELQNEKITKIKYDIPSRRIIDIITCDSKHLLGKAFDRINDLLIKYPGDKIMVAFNSVNGCFNLAENLRIKKGIIAKEISILCSTQSKGKVNEYFKELNNDKLPTRLNFITSAYFTGFDLHESFHLISISGNRSITQALSERRLKQIAGRCRNGLLSETIIHDYVIGETFEHTRKGYSSEEELYKLFNLERKEIESNNEVKPVLAKKKRVIEKDPTKEELISTATEIVSALNCMNKHYKRNKYLFEVLDDVNDKFLRLLEEKQMGYVRTDKDRNHKISYLNIDAKLESIRVKKDLYLISDALTKELMKGGHKVNTLQTEKTTKISDVKISSQKKDEHLQYIIKRLKEVKEISQIEKYLKRSDLNGFQKNIIRDFSKFFGYLNSNSILDKMEKSLLGKRDNREYNALLISAQIQTLPEGHIIIDRLKYHFPIGKKYTTQDILRRMSLFLLETGNTKRIKNDRQAIKMLNNFRKTYRKADKNSGTVYYHIQGENPFKIESIAKRRPLEEIELSLN